MKKVLRVVGVLLLLLIVVVVVGFMAGPTPKFEKVNAFMPTVTTPLAEIEEAIAKEEAKIPNIKEHNEAQIVWADSVRKTPYVLVYLHGFSASPMEGDPVHRNLAKKYGMNLYLPRLQGHGLEDDDSFLELTPVNYMNSAKKALATGLALGDTVILMGTSTGGTLATYLAAEHPEMVHALMMYAPNFRLANPFMPLATGHWGKDILRSAVGSDYREMDGYEEGAEWTKYWTYKYRIEGVIALQALLDQTMTEETFSKIDQPYYIGYYYKNEEEKDNTIDVDAILEFDQMTHTPEGQKELEAFAEAGEHVILSSLTSKEYQHVQEESEKFIEDVLGIKPIEVPVTVTEEGQ
ncbi:MAG: alpha/beta hydrolase [Bacteroidota bacterium]